jgi:ABC-type uncharacterized transport system ATPase subunit
MEAQEQAKQLDSVTDNVKEKEVDASRALEAMSALSTSQEGKLSAAELVAVSKDDVALIVSELEITDEAAEQALRDVAAEVKEGESIVVAALRKLVTT